MAYCPKCGVEVERDIKNCPLCECIIPDTAENSDPKDTRYPQAINTYHEDHQGKKNQAFFSIFIIAISMLVILGVIYLVYPWNHIIIKYISVGVVSILAMVFFFMGYLKPRYNFMGSYLTVMLAAMGIYLISDNQSGWFFNYAIPIVTLIYLDLFIFLRIFKNNRHRSQFIYIPTNLILFAIVLALGLDAVISLNVSGTLRLTWSLIVAVSGLCIIVLLQTIYHGIPEKTRKMLKKKMHF